MISGEIVSPVEKKTVPAVIKIAIPVSATTSNSRVMGMTYCFLRNWVWHALHVCVRRAKAASGGIVANAAELFIGDPLPDPIIGLERPMGLPPLDSPPPRLVAPMPAPRGLLAASANARAYTERSPASFENCSQSCQMAGSASLGPLMLPSGNSLVVCSPPCVPMSRAAALTCSAL